MAALPEARAASLNWTGARAATQRSDLKCLPSSGIPSGTNPPLERIVATARTIARRFLCPAPQSLEWSASRDLAGLQRITPEIVGVQFDQIEGVQENAFVMAAAADTIKCRDAVVITGDRLGCSGLPVASRRPAGNFDARLRSPGRRASDDLRCAPVVVLLAAASLRKARLPIASEARVGTLRERGDPSQLTGPGKP